MCSEFYVQNTHCKFHRKNATYGAIHQTSLVNLNLKISCFNIMKKQRIISASLEKQDSVFDPSVFLYKYTVYRYFENVCNAQ